MAVGMAGLAMRKDGMEASEWLMLAWMVGSALTGQIALLGKLGTQAGQAVR
jgi:hypothetical protein